MAKGSCLCGAVRYEQDGPIPNMVHCHCSMCRKHHGAEFATFAASPLGGFRWIAGEDQVVTRKTSSQGERSHCAVCSSVLPTLAREMDLAIIPAGNLEGDLGVEPQLHMFVASKAPWVEINDDLPQFPEYPPEFGMSAAPRADVRPEPGLTKGSCLCGKIEFGVEGEPMRFLHCWCSRCRRGRSASHGTNMVVPFDRFHFIAGEEHVSAYKPPDARFFTIAFCCECGSGAPQVNRERNFVLIPAGCLDTDPGARPTANLFVGSRAPWAHVTNGLTQHEEGLPGR